MIVLLGLGNQEMAFRAYGPPEKGIIGSVPVQYYLSLLFILE